MDGTLLNTPLVIEYKATNTKMDKQPALWNNLETGWNKLPDKKP